MKRKLKLFLAGKIDPLSQCVSPRWRDDMVWQLNQQLTSCEVLDTCLPNERDNMFIHEKLSPNVSFSQSCFYIEQSDALVVHLTDDISIGGSQEIFIAKMFNKPVIGIAPRGGKFNRLRYELGGKTFWNWVHPFVVGLCDLVVHDVSELAQALDNFDSVPCGGLSSITGAVTYYQRNAAALDSTINDILSFGGDTADYKPKMRIYFAGKMGRASNLSETAWRDHFAAIISQKSHVSAVNLDFLEPSHAVVDESDGKLIFGRDTYLIRSSDLVVVNLSNDISVGGCVEMMLAKLYHRPLIGIAQREGKFVSGEKQRNDKVIPNYINPFVAATCDWLAYEPSDLPAIIDQLATTRAIKSAKIVPQSSLWYKDNLLSKDRAFSSLLALT